MKTKYWLFLFVCLVMIQNLKATDLTSVLPNEKASFFQNLFINSAITDGPNCFNFALLFTGLIDKVRFVDGIEFQYRLGSNECKIIDDSENVRFGDLRVIYQRSNVQSEDFYPYHVQVFLSKDIVAEKSGMSKDNPYRVVKVPIAGRLNTPNKNGIRSSICTRAIGAPSECFSWVNIYRCKMDEVKSNIAEREFNKFIGQILAKVIELETQVESITLNISENKSDDYANAKNNLNKILSYLGLGIEDVVELNQGMISRLLAQYKRQHNFTNEEEVLRSITDLLYRIRGIDFQLMQIRYPQNSSKPASGLVL